MTQAQAALAVERHDADWDRIGRGRLQSHGRRNRDLAICVDDTARWRALSQAPIDDG